MKILFTALLFACCLPLGALAHPDDERESVEVAILDILLERGIIDQATFDELLLLAENQQEGDRELDLLQSQLQRLRAPDVSVAGGTPGRLQFSSADGRWSLGVYGRLQVRAELDAGEPGNRSDNSTNFSVPRARIGFFGQAGNDRVKYKLEIDTPTSDTVNRPTKDFALKDAYLDWLVDKQTRTHLSFGQRKAAFGREVHIASTTLNFVNESAASVEFSPGREPGVWAYGSTDRSFFQWWASITNGEGQSGSNQSGQDDTASTGLRHSVRLVLNPMGPLKRDGAAFQTVEDDSTLVAFGVSFMGNSDQPLDQDGDGEEGDSRANETTWGYEAQLVSGPLSVLAEKFKRERDLDAGVSDVDDDGYNVQAGYLLGGKRYEVVVRLTKLDFDIAEDMTETTLGFNIYNRGHNSKWAFDVSDIENDTALNKDRKRFRAQYQLVF